MPSFNLPDSVDLRPLCPPISDQGDLGACSTHAAVAGAWDFLEMKELREQTPIAEATEEFAENMFVRGSRLFAYYNERLIEGTVDQDAGACMRDAIKALYTYGCCPEDLWPYDITKFAIKPSDDCYVMAAKHKISHYSSITSLRQMKTILNDGYPFIFGIMIYDSFEADDVAKTGIVPMPDLSKEQCQGGHAVCAVGYDDKQNHIIVRNSWGTSWGTNGHFFLPYDFITNPDLAEDFWYIKK
jgi:C1A family cysteine protease